MAYIAGDYGLTTAQMQALKERFGYQGTFGADPATGQGNFADWLQRTGQTNTFEQFLSGQGVNAQAATSGAPTGAPAYVGSEYGVGTPVMDALKREFGYTGSFGVDSTTGEGNFAKWLESTGKREDFEQLLASDGISKLTISDYIGPPLGDAVNTDQGWALSPTETGLSESQWMKRQFGYTGSFGTDPTTRQGSFAGWLAQQGPAAEARWNSYVRAYAQGTGNRSVLSLQVRLSGPPAYPVGDGSGPSGEQSGTSSVGGGKYGDVPTVGTGASTTVVGSIGQYQNYLAAQQAQTDTVTGAA